MFRSVVGGFFKRSRLTLDNLVFRLHYRVTVGLLLACAVALLWKINYGRPLTCIVSGNVGTNFLNDYCWYDGLFTVSSSRDKTVGNDIPDIGYHNVHRWVVIGVLVQAAFFYLPRIIWRTLEGQMVRRLSWNMNEPKKTSSVKMFRKELIAGYLKSNSHRSIIYVGGHFLCEILNLVNVVVQLLLVSHILQLSFPSVNLIVQSRFQREDAPALSSFPLRTKCQFSNYGPTGKLVRYDVDCLMSVNAVMEFIFIFQWIWFVLLTILSVLAVIYRFLSLALPPIRAYRLASKASLSDFITVSKAVHRLGLGDWFVLYMMSKNLDPIDTRDILEGIIEIPAAKESQFLTINTGQNL